jgi:hypothetical protein
MRGLAVGIVSGCVIATAAFGMPLHPYTALDLPESLDPNFHLRSEPVKKIQVGSQTIYLEVTPLQTLQAKLGGVIQSGGDAGGAASWVCFTGLARKTPIVFWFISNGEMGNGTVSQVAIQRNTVGRPEGCSKAPRKLTTVDFGVPSFGSSQQAITHHFGGGPVGRAGVVNYVSERPVEGPSPGCTRMQGVQYLIRKSRVSTISVTQVSSC